MGFHEEVAQKGVPTQRPENHKVLMVMDDASQKERGGAWMQTGGLELGQRATALFFSRDNRQNPAFGHCKRDLFLAEASPGAFSQTQELSKAAPPEESNPHQFSWYVAGSPLRKNKKLLFMIGTACSN